MGHTFYTVPSPLSPQCNCISATTSVLHKASMADRDSTQTLLSDTIYRIRSRMATLSTLQVDFANLCLQHSRWSIAIAHGFHGKITCIVNGGETMVCARTFYQSWYCIARSSCFYIQVITLLLTEMRSFQLGYDETLFNSLLALPVWNRAFNDPSGSRLGLMAAYVSFGHML